MKGNLNTAITIQKILGILMMKQTQYVFHVQHHGAIFMCCTSHTNAEMQFTYPIV